MRILNELEDRDEMKWRRGREEAVAELNHLLTESQTIAAKAAEAIAANPSQTAGTSDAALEVRENAVKRIERIKEILKKNSETEDRVAQLHASVTDSLQKLEVIHSVMDDEPSPPPIPIPTSSRSRAAEPGALASIGATLRVLGLGLLVSAVARATRKAMVQNPAELAGEDPPTPLSWDSVCERFPILVQLGRRAGWSRMLGGRIWGSRERRPPRVPRVLASKAREGAGPRGRVKQQ